VYCVDSTFITDSAKLLAGTLTALSAMVHLELPHANVLTKCDLADKEALGDALAPSGAALAAALTKSTGPRFRALNESLARLLDDYDMVSFLPLDITDEDSLAAVVLHVDHAVQFGEDAEPKEPRDELDGEDGGGGGGGGGFGGDGDDGDGYADRLPADDGDDGGFGFRGAGASNAAAGGGDGGTVFLSADDADDDG
jgi:hypothetical protein